MTGFKPSLGSSPAKGHTFPAPASSVFTRLCRTTAHLCSAGAQTHFPFLFVPALQHCPGAGDRLPWCRDRLPAGSAAPGSVWGHCSCCPGDTAPGAPGTRLQHRESRYHRKAHTKNPPKSCFQFLQHYIISIICVAKVIAVTFLISLFEH